MQPRAANGTAKLRLLYECAPLALVVQAAGGAAVGRHGLILDQPVAVLDETAAVALGESAAVLECQASVAV